MSDKTGIEWTDATWNPIRGCSRVSEGCRNCYAEKVAARFSGAGQAYEGLAELKIIGQGTPKERSEAHWTGKISFIEKHLEDPMRWKRPRRIFVNSMSDLFHESLADSTIDKIFAVMRVCPQHTFQILTKRPKRMLAWFKSSTVVWEHPESKDRLKGERRDDVTTAVLEMFEGRNLFMDSEMLIQAEQWPLPNVWLGVSVEDQATADERIPLLLKTPAAVRWVSAEPLLGPIEPIRPWLGDYYDPPEENPGIDWLVCGGESGPGARPMHPEWARALLRECELSYVPFFFKQWGAWLPIEPLDNGAAVDGETAAFFNDGERLLPDCCTNTYEYDAGFNPWRFARVGKKKAGRRLDGVEYNGFPEVRA